MAKKFIKQGSDFALIVDKSVLEALNITEKTDLEMLVVGDALIIKSRDGQSNGQRQNKLEDSAKRIMDKYESVLQKLAKT